MRQINKKLLLMFAITLFLCTFASAIYNVSTDLSATDTGNWISTNAIKSISFDLNKRLYLGITGGKFGFYNITSNVTTDLSATDTGNWFTTGVNDLNAIDYDQDNGYVYIGTDGGHFGYYNNSNGIADSLPNITQSHSQAVKYDIYDNLVYLSYSGGNYGFYNTSSNITISLNNTDGSNWISTNAIKAIAISNSNNVYFGTDSGHFGFYNITSNVTTDLSATDTNDWITTSNIISLSYAEKFNSVYIGTSTVTFGNISFGYYNISSGVTNPFNITFLNKTNTINTLLYTPDTERIYLGTKDGMFGYYDILLNISVNLSGTFTANWLNRNDIYSLEYDNNSRRIYIGGLNGKFGYYEQYNNVALFINPTPNNDITYLAQSIINITCTNLPGNVTLWFDSNADPVTRILNNVSVNSSSVGAPWTTNVTTNGTYYYKASCGDVNTTVRTWTYNETGAGATASFVYPTPSDGAVNRTQVQINTTCSSLPSNLTLWFDSNTNPVTKIFNEINVNTTDTSALWTTNVTTNGTYYYKATCDNGTTNTSVRSWIYNLTNPVAFVNPTPTNNSYNKTQIIINTTCTVLPANVTLWFDSNANPITKVLSEVSVTSASTGALYTTAVTTNGTYYYKAICDGMTNSTIRYWNYNATNPASFGYPTPVNGSTNNTQININVSCEITPSNVSLWFDQNINPVTTILNNVDTTNWLTNVTSNGLYYMKSSCDNGLTNSTVRYWTFDNDTPMAILNPLNFFAASGTVINYTTSSAVVLNLSFTDNIAVYGFELNITNSTKNTIYNWTNISLSGTYANATKTINVAGADGVYTVNLTVWDKHTALSIDDYTVDKGTDYLLFDGKIKITAEEAITAKATKQKDRYSMDFTYDIGASDIKTFYIESDGKLDYIADSKYKAHFVDWKNKRWIDFEGLTGTPEVVKVNNNKYEITFDTPEKDIKFNSIGGLNYKEYAFSYLMNSSQHLSYPVFYSPTPTNGASYTTNQTIKIGCNYFQANLTLWYTKNITPPNATISTIDNVAVNDSTPFFTYTTNATEYNTYYYIVGCSINGYAVNSTIRSWILSPTSSSGKIIDEDLRASNDQVKGGMLSVLIFMPIIIIISIGFVVFLSLRNIKSPQEIDWKLLIGLSTGIVVVGFIVTIGILIINGML